MNHHKHEFCQDEPLVPGECTYTYPDGWMCGYLEKDHPLPDEKEYNGN